MTHRFTSRRHFSRSIAGLLFGLAFAGFGGAASAQAPQGPNGYPNTGDAWTNTAGILGRINFGSALTAGQIQGVKVNLSRFNFKDAATVAGELLGVPPSPPTLAAIEKGLQDKEASPSILAALIIGSPEFQRR